MSLQGAIEWIQDQVATVNSTANAPDNPTDLANSTNMWVIVYPQSGELISNSANFGHDLDTVRIDILTPRGELNEAMQRLEGYPHNIARKIQADPTFGGNAQTYAGITYAFLATEWAGVPVVGYALTVTGIKNLSTF